MAFQFDGVQKADLAFRHVFHDNLSSYYYVLQNLYIYFRQMKVRNKCLGLVAINHNIQQYRFSVNKTRTA